MSGSNVWRKYTTDAGVDYSIQVNERKSQTYVGGGAAQVTLPRTADYPILPDSISPRIIYASRLNVPFSKTALIVGNPNFLATFFQQVDSNRYLFIYGTPDGKFVNELWIPTGYTGEAQRNLSFLCRPEIIRDTGLDDGSP